mgnify:CR=1 FL=1
MIRKNLIAIYATFLLIAIKTDVTVDDDISNLIQTTKDHYGKIDILINNAGIYKQSDLQNTKISEINDLIDTNLKALEFCKKKICKNINTHNFFFSNKMTNLPKFSDFAIIATNADKRREVTEKLVYQSSIKYIIFELKLKTYISQGKIDQFKYWN